MKEKSDLALIKEITDTYHNSFSLQVCTLLVSIGSLLILSICSFSSHEEIRLVFRIFFVFLFSVCVLFSVISQFSNLKKMKEVGLEATKQYSEEKIAHSNTIFDSKLKEG
jgi:O-antigen/teichoic acid export membrane protein